MGFTQENYAQALKFFKVKDTKIYELLKKLKYVQSPPKRNIFSHLIGAIIGQRIRFTLARQQRGKLYTELGTDDFTLDDIINRGILYLQEKNLIDFDLEMIINKGLNYLLDIGIDEIRFKTIQRLVDYLTLNEIILTQPEQLDQLKNIQGIKDWTINCTKIMHSLDSDENQFDDCLLYEDLIIRRGINKLYGLSQKKDIIELAQSWSPWKGIVTWYLWKEFS